MITCNVQDTSAVQGEPPSSSVLGDIWNKIPAKSKAIKNVQTLMKLMKKSRAVERDG